MRLTEAELVSKCTTKFQQSYINKIVATSDDLSGCSGDCIGGVIKRGQLGWLAQGPLLEIHSIRNGQKISSYRFDYNLGFENCVITCVSETDAPGLNCCILAVGILFGDTAGGIVALYSIKESKVLRCIEIKEKVTSCQFIASEISKRTILHMMQGCLAVGTDKGKVLLLDLNLLKCEEALYSTRSEADIELVPCHIVSSTLEFSHIRQHHKHSKQENINFGIELERIDNAGLILSMLSLTPLLTLAVGLEDGRMILYDLSELQPIHVAYPPERLSPLVKIAYLEPPDDPRACIYIWTFHENHEAPIAVMHSIMYDKKITEDDGICLFEGFQCCNVRLTLPTYERGSLPVACRSIAKFPTCNDEEMLSLCLLAWKSQKSSHMVVFDINQWYKEEMPSVGDWRDDVNYLAHFELKDSSPLDVYIDPNTIASFNSIQRPEEHFYPISFCFDCIVMYTTGSNNLHWPGLQNRALDMLRSGGPVAILEPNVYFNEVMKASLIPQFSEYSNNSSFSINAQREILLSIALEYNCFGLLKECAKCWADGSFLGRKPYEGLSLSTLTEWIWNRAKNIKNRCNSLCVPLFDHSGLRIDQRSQNELSHLCRQLKLLADLYELVLIKCREYIPDSEVDTLTNQFNSIRMASEYQEVLQWLLNIGLLPEGVGGSGSDDDKASEGMPLVPYPYKILKNYYMNQRIRFGKLNKGFISSRTQSCRILYIDSFIEHECNANVLRDHWQESGGNGLYPPPSLQAMLRTLLVPDVPIENKYILFIYLFLDLNMAIEDESYTPIVQNLIKFPAVFKLNASLIKTLQAFWNLDHGQFEIALEEMVSPFSQDRKLSQWQQELLIEALLAQDQPALALQALQARASPISSLLELKTLLANDLVAEAYHLQRSKSDPELLRTFLNGCLYLGKWSVLRDLALTEEEGKMVEEFLRQAKSSKAENLHFVYLLQRSKYVEAISYLDELSKNKQNHRAVDLETPNLVLSAYNLTMTPATKHVSDIYCNIRSRIKPKDTGSSAPMPLSCELLKNGIKDITGGIYHSSALSTDQATIYWDDPEQQETNRLLDANNVPFVRQPQLDIMGFACRESLSYPEVFKGNPKRRLNDSSEIDSEFMEAMENPQKRRRVLDGSEPVLKSKKSLAALNSTLLAHLKDRTLSGRKLTDNKDSYSRSLSCSGEKIMQVLSTPIVKSCRIDHKDDFDTVDSNYERVCTPHSILKVKNIVRSSSPTTSIKIHKSTTPKPKDTEKISNTENQSETVEEEKSIRFELPRRSDITDSSFSLDDTAKGSGPSAYGPKKRRALRSADSSLITISDTDEFFSPVQSKDSTKIEENMDVDSDFETSAVKSREVQEEEDDESASGSDAPDNKQLLQKRECDEILRIEKCDKTPATNSGAISTENSPLKRRINITEGPKPRPPLRRSNTPPDQQESEIREESITINVPQRETRNRSRSKTPEIPSSPSRRSSRLAEKIERNIQPRKPLSRMVLEANAKRTVSSVIESVEISTNTILTRNRAEQLKEIEEVAKIDSSDFKPKATSSQLFQSSTKLATSDTNSGEISNLDYEMSDISTTDFYSATIASIAVPKQILPDDSVLSDSFIQKWENRAGDQEALMTTMEMTEDLTFSTLRPPRNLLSDSDSEGDQINIISHQATIENDNKSEVKEQQEEDICEEDNTKDTSPDEKDDLSKEKEEEEMENKIQNVENLNVILEKAEEIKANEGGEDLTKKEEKIKIIEELEISTSYEDVDDETDEELVHTFKRGSDGEESAESGQEENDEKVEIHPVSSEGEAETVSEEEDSVNQSVEAVSDSDEEAKPNAVINISSSSDEEILETTEEISGDAKQKENVDSGKAVSSPKDVSDLLYGDINPSANIERKEDEERSENDELNDAIIMGRSSVGEHDEAKFKIQQDTASPIVEKEEEQPKEDHSGTTALTTSAETVQGESTTSEISKKVFEIEPAMPAANAGMTINFLTGEEEKLDETGDIHTVEDLNEARVEETSVIATESEISCIETSISDYKSFTEDKTISSISVMEVDEDPCESVYSNNDPLNEQILDDTIKTVDVTTSSKVIEEISTPHVDEVKIIKSPAKSDTESTIKDDNRRLNIPILVVSTPEEVTCENQVDMDKEDEPAKKQIEKSPVTTVKQEPGNNEEEQTKLIKVEGNPNTTQSSDYLSAEVTEAPTNPSPDVESDTSKITANVDEAESTVHNSEQEISDVKLQVSDDENPVASENKKSKASVESPLKRKNPDRNYLDVESTTPSSSRTLRNRRARSESTDINPNSLSDPPALERVLRATSVPRTESGVTPKQRKLRRLSESSDVLSPSRILTRRQSQLLEKITEDELLDSPSNRTRSRKRLDSIESEPEESSPSMSKRTRRNSVSSVGTPDVASTPRSVRARSILSEENSQSTPRRTRQSISKEIIGLEQAKKHVTKLQEFQEILESSDSTGQETPKVESETSKKSAKTSKTTTKSTKKLVANKDQENESKSAEKVLSKKIPKKTTSKSGKSTSSKPEAESSESEAYESEDEVASHKSSETSKRSNKSTRDISSKSKLMARKWSQDIKAGGDTYESPNLEDVSSSRRLTRNQLAIIEKGLSSPAAEPKKITKRRSSKVEESPVKRTDHESETESIVSGKGRRSTRNSAKDDVDETSSIASSTRSRASLKSKKEQTHTKTSKGKNLKAIPEEDMDGLSSDVSSEEEAEQPTREVPKKRGRTKKSNK